MPEIQTDNALIFTLFFEIDPAAFLQGIAANWWYNVKPMKNHIYSRNFPMQHVQSLSCRTISAELETVYHVFDKYLQSVFTCPNLGMLIYLSQVKLTKTVRPFSVLAETGHLS